MSATTAARWIETVCEQRGPIRDYLSSLPPDTRLYPDKPCGCILHDLIARQYPGCEAEMTYQVVSLTPVDDPIACLDVPIDGTLWERLQRAWSRRHDGRDDEGHDYIYPATALAVLEATR